MIFSNALEITMRDTTKVNIELILFEVQIVKLQEILILPDHIYVYLYSLFIAFYLLWPSVIFLSPSTNCCKPLLNGNPIQFTLHLCIANNCICVVNRKAYFYSSNENRFVYWRSNIFCDTALLYVIYVPRRCLQSYYACVATLEKRSR